MTRGGNDFTFVTGNYKVRTKARDEWLYVVGDESGRQVAPPASDMGHGRVIRAIDELLRKPLAQAAKLTREEMIAIVMYTGPAFVLYNAVLRQFPADIYSVFKDGDNLFPTTIFVLVSAVNKLSRCMNIPPGTLLYRGLGGTLEFPDRFTRADADCVTPNALGFLEYGFMSTTAEKSVAVQYSGVKEGKPRAGILQICPNSVDRGADISEFSQYPGEKEFLFVPYSFVQGEGRQRTEVVTGGGVLTVVPVRVNINLKTETVDELKEKKKRLHLVSARAMVEEVRYELGEWAKSSEAAARLQRDTTRNQGGTFTAATLAAAIVKQCEDVVKRHEAAALEEYVDDGAFRALVGEMLDTKTWAKEKKELWMRDASQLIFDMQNWSLRDCHRTWVGFLRKFVRGAADGSSERASASLELLSSRGLALQGVDKENVDGEGVMVQAGADGWQASDIVAAVAAGADVGATGSDGLNGVDNAALYGNAISLAALLSAGSDLTNDCIWHAAYSGHADCLELLLGAGGDVGTRVEPLFVGVPRNCGTLVCCRLSFDNIQSVPPDITGRCQTLFVVRPRSSLALAPASCAGVRENFLGTCDITYHAYFCFTSPSSPSPFHIAPLAYARSNNYRYIQSLIGLIGAGSSKGDGPPFPLNVDASPFVPPPFSWVQADTWITLRNPISLFTWAYHISVHVNKMSPSAASFPRQLYRNSVFLFNSFRIRWNRRTRRSVQSAFGSRLRSSSSQWLNLFDSHLSRSRATCKAAHHLHRNCITLLGKGVHEPSRPRGYLRPHFPRAPVVYLKKCLALWISFRSEIFAYYRKLLSKHSALPKNYLPAAKPINILVWNVGADINAEPQHSIIVETLKRHAIHIACLQEFRNNDILLPLHKLRPVSVWPSLVTHIGDNRIPHVFGGSLIASQLGYLSRDTTVFEGSIEFNSVCVTTDLHIINVYLPFAHTELRSRIVYDDSYLLSHIRSLSSDPERSLLIVGDFNVPLSSLGNLSSKDGQSRRSQTLMSLIEEGFEILNPVNSDGLFLPTHHHASSRTRSCIDIVLERIHWNSTSCSYHRGGAPSLKL